MNFRRLFEEGGEEGFKLPSRNSKRQRLFPNIFRWTTGERDLENILLSLEPKMRTWVHDEVNNAFKKLSTPYNQVELPGCRTWQLRFQSSIRHSLYTGRRVVAQDKTPVKVILYDSVTQEIVSGPSSSIKVGIVVLESQFNPDENDGWTEQQFECKTVKNREGKKPLVTGELTVQLRDGVGYIGDMIFNDNSRCIRGGKFRLGAKALNTAERGSIREGISNAFKVKDYRGESYEKHYPPSLHDKIWRLEKIAKDGPSDTRLAEFGIYTVQDFLKKYYRNALSLQNLLPKTSNKIWETIVSHAETCTLDDKLYLYSSAQGIGLVFNSVDRVVRATFDGQTYHSLDKLDSYHMRMVENLKQVAYENSNNWVLLSDSLHIDYPIPVQLENTREENFNSSYFGRSHFMGSEENLANVDKWKESDHTSFEIGESSRQMESFNPSLRNNFETSDSPLEFYLGNLPSPQGDHFMEPGIPYT